MSAFDKCIEVILKNEGGYVNHPADPGGETNFGIAKRFFPGVDIKNLTKEQAIGIYHANYWKPMNLDGIWDGELVLQVFDFGVNAGKRRSIRTLQRIVGAGADGIIGPQTTKMVNYFKPVRKDGVCYTLLEFFKDERKAYYINLADRKPSLNVFLRGWLNRIEHTHL